VQNAARPAGRASLLCRRGNQRRRIDSRADPCAGGDDERSASRLELQRRHDWPRADRHFTVADPSANNSPQTGSVTVNVFDHASTGGFSGGAIGLPSVIVGYNGPIGGNTSLSATNGNTANIA